MTAVKGIGKLLLGAILCLPGVLSAQEAGSADLTTEVVQDAFQENFFEALKEKGIGNLDKALAFLSRCREMDSGQAVVNYEMGRIFLEQKQYPSAHEHLLLALESDPSNVWFLKALVDLFLEQEELGKAVDIAEAYSSHGREQQVLLAELYIANGDTEKARNVLNNDELSHALPVQVEALRSRIQAAGSEAEVPAGSQVSPEAPEKAGSATGSLNELKASLSSLAESGQFELLLERSNEAVDNFPAQPEFYYFKALGLLKTGEAEKVLGVSEEGLAYLLDDKELELSFYQLMKEAYEQLGNEKKRKEIEEKIRQ